MAIMGFDDETKRMKVISINPGYTEEGCSEKLRIRAAVGGNLPKPTRRVSRSLRILRKEVDPQVHNRKMIE